jgi:hypothetical protein
MGRQGELAAGPAAAGRRPEEADALARLGSDLVRAAREYGTEPPRFRRDQPPSSSTATRPETVER